jgi:ABC-2 type transport system ATP-binding protein
VTVSDVPTDQARPLVIETSDLTKVFGARTALDHADLRVPKGVAFGFLGPNGAGKTTLIRVLLGLTPPSSGEMRLLGMPVPAERGTALQRVGAIVEEPHFHSHLTGRENLRIAAACREPEAHARIQPSLERVGLTERADDRVKTYSLGMRQRLGIARCLLADPELLILDEPANGLDPAGILEFREFVRSFVDDGRTVFLSSHLLDEVEKICDMAAIVDQGKILMQGTVSEIAAGGHPTIMIGVNDVATAERVLLDHPAVAESGEVAGGVRLVLSDGSDAAIADINRRLVEAGLKVHRIEPAHMTLEERFLEVTSRFGAAT